MKDLPPPILVTGLPRSGTSVVAGTLQACGVWLGECRGNGPLNPKGFYENEAIKNRTTKSLLRLEGCDQHGLVPPGAPINGGLPEFHDIMNEQGYQGGPWAFKDPKILLCWPAWVDTFPDAKWVIVTRSSNAADLSRQASGFTPGALRKYVQFQLELTGRIGSSCIRVVSPEYVRRPVRDLGLKWTEEAGDFFDPSLWNRQTAGAA